MFENKVAIITGAGGGIGATVAKDLYEKGAKLTLVDVSDESLTELSKNLKLNPDNSILLKADVSREGNVKYYVDKTVEKFGRIDIFVNNAGVEGKVSSIVETKKEDLDFVLNINVKGVYFGLKYVMAEMMKNNSGSIINISSVAGFMGSPGLCPYVASKHAVIGITKTAALEGAPSNIRVNAVCPGPVDNRMMRSIEDGAAPGNGDAVKAEFLKTIPLGRYASNEDIANLINFLASDASTYITGQTYRIDGGMNAK